MIRLSNLKRRFQSYVARRILKTGPEPVRKRFPIKTAFPPSDPLATDIVRLLAAYNDFSSIEDWIYQDRPKEEYLSVQSRIDFIVSKIDLQWRLLGSILHESLPVIDQFATSPSSKPILEKLNEEGRAALDKLLSIPRGDEPFSRKILAFTRNKLSYHYDIPVFQQGLNALLESKGDAAFSHVLLLTDEHPRREFYFPLADDVRERPYNSAPKTEDTHPRSKLFLMCIVFFVYS